MRYLDSHWIRVFLLATLALVSAVTQPDSCSAAGRRGAGQGVLELEVKSQYSHIRIRRTNQVRSLLFVRDTGDEVVETALNLKQPHELISPYTRYMFLSYLFQPKQSNVLIVGLGGGAMVHFIKHHDPEVNVDVVEIDPKIVEISEKYFGIQNDEKLKVFTDDGVKFLQTTESKYDVIYMDAFLKPAADTDGTGIPLALKSAKFYDAIQQRLNPNGLVVFNINPGPDLRNDVETIRISFGQIYKFDLPHNTGSVVAATLSRDRLSYPTLIGKAIEIDRRFDAPFSFKKMTESLDR